MELSTMSEISDPDDNDDDDDDNDDDDDIWTGDTENNDLGIIRGRVSGIPIIAFETLSSAEAVVCKGRVIAIFIVFLEKQKECTQRNSK